MKKQSKPMSKPGAKAEMLKNRIVGRAMVDAKTLKAHPLNARIHPEPQRLALEAVLNEIGWVQDVIVNQRTGFILNGHLRVEIAAARGEKVPVVYVDLSPAEERLILAALDPVGEMALTDEAQLTKLLDGMKLDDGSELSLLLASLLTETAEETPKPAGDGPVKAATSPRNMGNRHAQIKPVLYAAQVQRFEQALQLTGEINRGKALMKVCEFYVEANTE